MNQPRISVLIPVYNAQQYLPDCLAAISRQTFEHFEIICVDDGSTDDSLQILKKFSQQDPRLRIISQPNAGVACTRNHLLQEARGIYVAFVDASYASLKSLCIILS